MTSDRVAGEPTVAEVVEHLPDDLAAGAGPLVDAYLDDAGGAGPQLGGGRLAAAVAAHVVAGWWRHDDAPVVSVSATALDVVTDDVPYLVDGVRLALDRARVPMGSTVHPVIRLTRKGDGSVGEVGAGSAESWIHVELPVAPADPGALVAAVTASLADARQVAADALRLRRGLQESAAELSAAGATDDAALLRWLLDGHLALLGGDDGDGLGVLRGRVAELATRPLPAGPTVVVAKAPLVAGVHRQEYLDEVLVVRGGGLAPRRFVGLLTPDAMRADPDTVPKVREAVGRLVAKAGFPADSHSARVLQEVIGLLRVDELLRIEEDALEPLLAELVDAAEHPTTRLHCWPDPDGWFVWCHLVLPSSRFNAALVGRVESVLADALHAVDVETRVDLDAPPLACIHVLARRRPGAPAAIDVSVIERRLAALSQVWSDHLRQLVADSGGADARLADRYADAFPRSYRDRHAPLDAIGDIERIEALGPEGVAVAWNADRPSVPAGGAPAIVVVYRRAAPLTLSAVLPLFDQLGLEVIDEHPTRIEPAGAPAVYRYEFSVRPLSGAAAAEVPASWRAELERTLAGLLAGTAEPDRFNRLVLAAGMPRRRIDVLRAVARYLRQIGSAFALETIADTLEAHPRIATALVRRFEAAHDPDGAAADRDREVASIDAEILAELDAVASLDQDRILRAVHGVIVAVVRTNAFIVDGGPDVLACKLDGAQVPDLPLPRPMFEIWVSSPRVEGVHLRGGRVARGGIRWSDRRDDFRTEILGLMKAQQVKNAVIVPVGAKGGFVLKRAPAEPEALRAEGVACYKAFIGALLDVTDNVVDGVVVGPSRVVRHDGDDPYLVVAADKGTATFSDIANDIAVGRRFWLGDAFASGGSAGYDHKEMGITARGAWESVRRHARSIGLDADRDAMSVVGIGDMSGDVFGNGMLLSRHLRLVAAFDHRHVFIDPDPDPEVSFAERRRLYELPRSSWADYDRSLLSPGGLVVARSTKSVTLSPEACTALGITSPQLSATELVRALLCAPVDLLWNGGIGTYVKATSERHTDVGDRANDAVRVDASQLRCRIVAEGGNLGFTQRARIEASLNGVFVNTDFIDNSAGVDCSDHEVNVKILLEVAMRRGLLDPQERNALLASLTDEVAELVLADNREQNLALMIARTQAAALVDVHARYVRSLELEGLIDRQLEFLPSPKELAERQAAGIGLTVPELAVLLAYTKSTDVADLLTSDVPDDPYLDAELASAFPAPVRTRFGPVLREHRLHREILATRLVNDMVNRAGTSFDHRLTEETGARVPDITRAHVVSRDVFAMAPWWAAIEALDGQVEPPVQVQLLMDLRRLVERGTQWLLRNRRPPVPLDATVAAFRPGVAALEGRMASVMAGAKSLAIADLTRERMEHGVPADLALRSCEWPYFHTAFDIVEVATARRRDVLEAASAYWEVFDRMDVDWLWDRIGALPRTDRWQSHARASLRDDLLRMLRELAHDALRSGDAFSAPGDLVSSWMAANEHGVQRIRQVFAEIKAGGVFDLTTCSVALRQLRNLAQTAAAV